MIGAKGIEAHGAGATVAVRLGHEPEVLEAAVAGSPASNPALRTRGCRPSDVDGREVLGTQPVSLVYKREVGREPAVRAVIRLTTSSLPEVK